MYIKPNWPAPENIQAVTTLRMGGVSSQPFDQFNLAEHVGDNPLHVRHNRDLLKKELALPNEPCWLNQTHSTVAIQATQIGSHADASFTEQSKQICVILTADCLPILLCNREGTFVAAIHAGWRGLLNGIIASTITQSAIATENLLAWLGPAISQKNYEVGPEVRAAFIKNNPESAIAFIPSGNDRWFADLYALARLFLLAQGIQLIFGGEFCTYADPKRFYSYRRDGSATGRMATLIWISEDS